MLFEGIRQFNVVCTVLDEEKLKGRDFITHPDREKEDAPRSGVDSAQIRRRGA